MMMPFAVVLRSTLLLTLSVSITDAFSVSFNHGARAAAAPSSSSCVKMSIGAEEDSINNSGIHDDSNFGLSRRTALQVPLAAALALGTNVNPAYASIPTAKPADDYTIVAVQHGTPSYEAWEKRLMDQFYDEKKQLITYPPEMKVLRQLFGKSVTKRSDGGDTVVSVMAFENDALPAVQKFFDSKQDLWVNGKKEGWLLEPLEVNYVKADFFRGSSVPSLKNKGLCFVSHGIGNGQYQEWQKLPKSSKATKTLDKTGCFALTGGPGIAGTKLGGYQSSVATVQLHTSGTKAKEFTDEFPTFYESFKETMPTVFTEPSSIRYEPATIKLDFVYPPPRVDLWQTSGWSIAKWKESKAFGTYTYFD